MRNYLDVTVLVLPDDDGSYRVRVDSDEGGQGSATMRLPFAMDALTGGGPAAPGDSRAMSFGGPGAEAEGIARHGPSLCAGETGDGPGLTRDPGAS